MNNNVMSSRVRMESSLLQQLFTEVKETVATDVKLPVVESKPAFKAINLWNIQRRGRYTMHGTQRKKHAIVSLSHVAF